MLNVQSSDSEDDFEDEEEEDNKFKTTTHLDTKDESKYLGLSNQGSDSQQHNCDLHFQLKTLLPNPSCVIS